MQQPVWFGLPVGHSPGKVRTMRRDLNRLANTEFDLLVIGGGILGAGIARDAALRGLRVALVEQRDFASGTSSRSTKLIHGGFRYLEQGAVKLVAESCRERAILQRIAPHLVKPLSFLFVVYEGDRRPLWLMRAGLTLYDWLARGRAPGRHRAMTAAETRAEEPALQSTGLQGAVLFYDCQEDDARFCIDNIHHAADLGAVCVNYCGVTGLVRRGDRVVAASVEAGFEVRAKWFINATGVWAGRLASSVKLAPTKGVHLVVPRVTRQHGVFWQARDGRLVFVIPWWGESLVGSTDTDYAGDPAAARAEPADVNYLLSELRRRFPNASTEVITSFAGVRPLLAGTEAPSARSREHQLVREGANFLSVIGGKYTTYRAIAAEVVEATGLTRAQCQTDTTPLPRYRPSPNGEQFSTLPDVWESDVRYAWEEEMALTLSDVMRRRTPLALTRHGDAETAARVAAILGRYAGWSESEQRAQLKAYLGAREHGTL
ncbi:MAG: glycerol-3-phosphate dehydrogenase/oxidase [Verrucomicrobiae bacterium]|nr:glycerol-3-phosphate dehydrogenase/oxidase [Verrucomicrobiae bacterium]